MIYLVFTQIAVHNWYFLPYEVNWYFPIFFHIGDPSDSLPVHYSQDCAAYKRGIKEEEIMTAYRACKEFRHSLSVGKAGGNLPLKKKNSNIPARMTPTTRETPLVTTVWQSMGDGCDHTSPAAFRHFAAENDNVLRKLQSAGLNTELWWNPVVYLQLFSGSKVQCS